MDVPYTLTTFTPAEAERVTTLSTVNQRDWRRRGYLLSTTSGHARFGAFALAEMWALKLLADRGVGPQEAQSVARMLGAGIVRQALLWVDAYEGDHLRTFDWLPEHQRPRKHIPAEMRTILEAAAAEIGTPNTFDAMWEPKAEFLARQILAFNGFSQMAPANYFIWWADGQFSWHTSLDQAFKGFISDDPRCAGAVIVLDTHALASTFIDRTGRALVHVEFPPGFAGDGLQAPLEFGEPVAFDGVMPNGAYAAKLDGGRR